MDRRRGLANARPRPGEGPLPPNAPVVVLVHGIGVSSRYMVPTAIKLAETCHV